jgi:hypothetical protein
MQRKTTYLRRRQTTVACLAVALLLALTLLSIGCWRHWRNRLLAAYCEDGLTTANEEQAAASLELLMALREPGMAAVVRAIGNPVAATRELAYHKLVDELNRLESEPRSPVRAERLSDFVRALADSVDDLPELARQRVAVLAMKVLAQCQELPMVDRDAAIAACHQVLDAAKPRERSQPSGIAAPDYEAVTKNKGIKQPAAAPKQVHPVSDLDLSQFSAPPLARADVPGEDVHAEPHLFFAHDTAALASKPPEPRRGERSTPIAVAAYTADVAGANNDEQETDLARREARELDIIALFTRLHDTRPKATSARVELEARGYSQRQIEVGQHLVSPDAEERLRWTEWLPGIRGIDARFWLLRLSHDPHAQVRRAAVGLLATDRDPEVVRRLQRVVIEETDERVRDQASRTLEAAAEP